LRKNSKFWEELISLLSLHYVTLVLWVWTTWFKSY